jgi:N-acetylglucosamine-6-phosphate deacetylase
MTQRYRHFRTGETVTVDRATGTLVPDGGPAPDLPWIAPALFDPQINGCHGVSFNSETLTVEDVRRVVEVCRSHGVGRFFPTLVTNSFAALRHGFATLRLACETDSLVRRTVPGFHLEGPYLSPEDGPRGAHPRAHVRRPDPSEFERLQEAAGGLIRLVTLSPEYDESLAFIERLASDGITVAIGHTAALPQQIADAVAAGARMSTHLGNGCHAALPRHTNYLWEQLACDGLWASFIPDGHHLPATFVNCLLRCKTLERCVVTCDASSLAGCEPGRYRQWDTELEVQASGRVVVPGTPFLAGSGMFTDQCLARLLRMTDLTLADAIDLTTARPRALLNLPEATEWVVFDWSPGGELTVRELVERGGPETP